MANEITSESDVFSTNVQIQRPQRVLIVTSPKAGTGLGRERLPQLVDRLRLAGIDAVLTDQLAKLREFAAEAESCDMGTHLVVAAGGDGTLSLVAENVFATMPLVPMPMGTENLLARQFGYTSDPGDVFRTVTEGKSYWLDAGRANGKLFLVMASCGFDAEVVRGLHLTRKGHISRLSYANPILRAISRYSFPTVYVETESSEEHVAVQRDCKWAMAFNLPRYGGDLSIEPDAIGDDGRLDVITFKRGSLFSGLRYVFGIKTGLHRKFRDVDRHQAKRVRMTSDSRVPYQLDGDYVGRLPLTIEVLPGRIHLRLPADPARELQS